MIDTERMIPSIAALPVAARMTMTKAVSVEMTMPHAGALSVPALNHRKIRARTTIPASAAKTGTPARRHSRSFPMTKSFLASRLTRKKNIIIRASLIQCWTDRRISEVLRETANSVCQNSS